MAVTIHSAQVNGLEAQPISVEVDIAPGLHTFSIVGLADKEVQESRERISAAIKNLGALAPHKKSQRVIINLAPANLRKEGPAFDVAIALGYLLASEQINFNPKEKLFLGELGLDGKIRVVSGTLPVAMIAQACGFKEFFVPKGNGGEAAIIDGLNVFETESLSEIIEHLSGRKEISKVAKSEKEIISQTASEFDFSDIRGQEKAKRALEIAAAGNHNCLLSGPPGAGKTLLARALPSILPPLSFEETLEVTRIYSVSGLLNPTKPIINERPFRNPHHTSSHTSIIGGGSYPRPGEITLAHRGVLFLDEFPEFDRRVIESLRQPIEERKVTVARSQGVETFPAQFMLIAAMNPCPCGNFGNPKKLCDCGPGAISRYRKKISGPLLDRIDLHIETPNVEYEELAEETVLPESSVAVRQRVHNARELQKKRFRGLAIKSNAEMGLQEIKKFIVLDPELKRVLRLAHDKYRLSARAYHRVLKLSRSIADLEGTEEIRPNYISEALQYRPRIND